MGSARAIEGLTSRTLGGDRAALARLPTRSSSNSSSSSSARLPVNGSWTSVAAMERLHRNLLGVVQS